MVVRGVWPVGAAGEATTPIFQIMTAISMLGLLFTGAYILKAVRHVLHGPLNQQAVELAHGRPLEITLREVIAMVPLLVLMLLIGVFPAWLVGVINGTVTACCPSHDHADGRVPGSRAAEDVSRSVLLLPQPLVGDAPFPRGQQPAHFHRTRGQRDRADGSTGHRRGRPRCRVQCGDLARRQNYR
jgi:hypothetical protein